MQKAASRARSYRSLLVGFAVLIASPQASAVTIEWVTVGHPGNAPDTEVMSDGTTGYGSVAEVYRISKYETTNAQYAEFLNAKAASDPLGLYNTSMGSTGLPGVVWDGITRSGSPGSYSYSAIAGRENWPVNYVSFYDSLRFSNWLHNGQGSGDTETGAYTLLGGTPIPSNGSTVTRNAGANIFLTSEDEWYKAAYFDGSSYFDHPAGTDAELLPGYPGATPNTGNLWPTSNYEITDVGSFTASASPYGTFDQGGNVWEWNEAIISPDRGLRGGGFDTSFGPYGAAAEYRILGASPNFEEPFVGFRVATKVPEPTTGLLLGLGLLGVVVRRRV